MDGTVISTTYDQADYPEPKREKNENRLASPVFFHIYLAIRE